ACCTSPTSRPASGRPRSRRCSTAATRSRSAWSRSTASAAGSACAWPTTPRSPARRRRSSPRSRPAAATAAARAATAATAATGGTAAAAAPGARAAALGGTLTAPRLTELDSGVRVVTESMDSVRSVALGFWIGTGSVGEGDDEAGLSHLIEHMLFRGTANYGSLEIDQLFDAMGAEINAGTGKETTSVYSRILDIH